MAASTTYRGVRLAVRKGRQWAHRLWLVNGEPWGEWTEPRDDQAVLARMRAYVDEAALRPGSNPTFEPAQGD